MVCDYYKYLYALYINYLFSIYLKFYVSNNLFKLGLGIMTDTTIQEGQFVTCYGGKIVTEEPEEDVYLFELRDAKKTVWYVQMY